MRRGTALAVPLLSLTVLIAAVVAEIPKETGLAPGAQAQLESYITYWYPSGSARIEAVARAGLPWNLTADQSLGLLGTSFRFPDRYGQSSTESHHPQQLLFPPEQVWCVLLEPEAGVEAGPLPVPSYDLVIVALHLALYEADWMVHKPREALPFEAIVESLEAIGCDLGLDQVGPLNTGS